MRYMFLIYLDEHASEARSPAERAAAVAAHAPYIEMLRRNRRYAASDALAPARSARTLRGAGGKPVATQGPFAESREQLGGYYIVDAPDLDEAIRLASQNPALATVGVAIEIRPSLAGVAETPGAGDRFLLAVYRDGELDADAWTAFVDALRGRLEAAELLAPAGSATTMRLADDKTALADGPFADTRAQIAACAVVRAADLDDAVALAARCGGGIEVRAIRATL